jgi:hypothetical protein
VRRGEGGARRGDDGVGFPGGEVVDPETARSTSAAASRRWRSGRSGGRARAARARQRVARARAPRYLAVRLQRRLDALGGPRGPVRGALVG